MGLNKQTAGSGGGNILHVKRGAICLESSVELEGYQYTSGEVDGTPYEKWILKNGSVDGMVTGVFWYDTAEEGDGSEKQRFQGLKVEIVDGDETYLLDLPYGKGPYDNFTKFAENIDFSKPVEFIAYPDKERPTSTVLNAKQDGQIIRQKYTKDNLGDCPPAVQNKLTKKWNFDDQREWLLNNLLENVVPKIKQQNTGDTAVTHAEPKTKKAKAAATEGEDRWAGVPDVI